MEVKENIAVLLDNLPSLFYYQRSTEIFEGKNRLCDYLDHYFDIRVLEFDHIKYIGLRNQLSFQGDQFQVKDVRIFLL